VTRSTTSSPVEASVPTAFSRQLVLFTVVCLIWGLTWIPAKVGVERIPAALLAGLRGLAAGPLVLLVHRLRGRSLALPREDRVAVLELGLLTFAATYGLLFWGVARVPSGLAAVVNLSLAPTFLLVFGVAFGQEQSSPRQVLATLLGIVGLAVLYAGELAAPTGSDGWLGLLAIVTATLTYVLGVVRGRPLLFRHEAALVAGWSQLAGGAMLLAFVALRSPEAFEAVGHLGEPAVLASLAFLVVFGSVVAFSLYLRLTHEWGPHRAGFYAFVSPAVAVLAGAVFLGERTAPLQLVGMALMMAGTLTVLRRRRAA